MKKTSLFCLGWDSALCVLHQTVFYNYRTKTASTAVGTSVPYLLNGSSLAFWRSSECRWYGAWSFPIVWWVPSVSLLTCTQYFYMNMLFELPLSVTLWYPNACKPIVYNTLGRLVSISPFFVCNLYFVPRAADLSILLWAMSFPLDGISRGSSVAMRLTSVDNGSPSESASFLNLDSCNDATSSETASCYICRSKRLINYASTFIQLAISTTKCAPSRMSVLLMSVIWYILVMDEGVIS